MKIKSLLKIWLIGIAKVETVYFYDFYLVYAKEVKFLFELLIYGRSPVNGEKR